jgi:hypothetical protein
VSQRYPQEDDLILHPRKTSSFLHECVPQMYSYYHQQIKQLISQTQSGRVSQCPDEASWKEEE